ncbi:hypothetical protein HJ588_01805 [Flexivirga sp. ID2601S]|uniref:DUF4352 domain-containing protein n=1 Tax=Flexivirga aerilata TaxID=1656889 RepID=A0A849AFJ2_9MICO|nr:hypothetical protein [Flexivirga aerilata]NNG38011.1 hypothetical protein [Flexivirga aerilata]
MSRTTVRRGAAAALAVAGAFTLAACNNSDSASVTTPSATSSAAPSTTTETTPSTTESSQAPSTSETTESSPATSDTSSAASGGASTPVSGPTEVSDPDGKFKIGQPAVIKDDDDTFRLTPTALEVAPDSAYNETRRKKTDGTLYYLKFDITAIKTNATFFGTNSVNGLFFHPAVPDTVKNAKRLYGDTDACKSESKELKAGESGSSCYIYQIPGAPITSVTYNDYDHNIVWTK